MKKLIFAGLCLISFSGFAQDKKEVLAVPNFEGGYYQFARSKPAGEFEFVSNEKIKLVVLSTNECKSRQLKRLKEFPEVNAIIFNNTGDWCDLDYIILK